MKKTFILMALAILSLSCAKGIEIKINNENAQPSHKADFREVTITASPEQVETKTYFDKSTGALTWTTNESNLAVYDGTDLQAFTYEGATDGKASFTGTADVAAASWTAVHPASHAALEGGKVYVTFPCIQEAGDAGGLKADMNTVAAQVTHDGAGNIDDCVMKNVGGLLKLTVAKTGIKTITVSSRGGQALTGKAELSFDGSGNPVVTPVATKYETFVTLKASNLSTGLAAGEYFVSVFPAAMTTGLIIDMENIDGTVASIKTTASATVNRNSDLEFSGFDTKASWYTPEETTISFNFTSGWPFDEAIASGANDAISTGWGNGGEKVMTYTSDKSILFYVNCLYYMTRSASNGLRIKGTAGDYLLLPALPGKSLKKIVVKHKAADTTHPAIMTRGGNAVVEGGSAEGSADAGDSHTWTLSSTAHNMQYRYQLTNGATAFAFLESLELTYISKPSAPAPANIVLDVRFWEDNGTANGKVNQPFKDYTIPGTKTSQNQPCTFEYDGNDYTFEIGGSYRILASGTNRGLGLNNNGTQLGYIKVPGISGYRLASMSAVAGGPATDGNINQLSLDFSTTATENSADRFTAAASTMSEPSSFSKTFDSTENGVAYYFVVKWGWLTLRNIYLVYTPVSSPSPSPAPAPAQLLDGGITIL